MIENKVKLVIWDMDETFWQGTLGEGGITPVTRNVEIVHELSRRGIVNSISSKNDRAQARAKLIELGVWDQFVFPSISFNPKGKAIAEMIEAASLRADDVLFLDDNPANLEEAKFFNPGIMTANPADVLDGLLAHPHMAGKPDPELTRLKQYRVLQGKFEDRIVSELSNAEFLRASNIRVEIDYDIAANFDRIVELINRTNQLNYTKRRFETPESIAEFREQLNGFGYYAGCVRAKDNYGDYGLIGFFLMQRRAKFKRLVHFVFSCRTMNMGIEQYVYEKIGEPKIEIAKPVSYGLNTHDKIDWINTGTSDGGEVAGLNDTPLLLVGGCDLMQLANYCSSNRIEFVNSAKDDTMVRFDDPGFIAGDREAIRTCESIKKIPNWTYEDALRFDEAVTSSQMILLSMWTAMVGIYLKVEGKILIRQSKERSRRFKREQARLFKESFEKLALDTEARIALVADSFDAIARKLRPDAKVFVLGIQEPAGDGETMVSARKAAFNAFCRDYCERHPGQFHFVDVSSLMTPDKLEDNRHLSREGYFILAKHILALAASA